MRRMSFSATIQPMHDLLKTLTSRHVDTWKNLKPGDRLLAIEKGMGLAKGEKQTPIGVIEVVSNTVDDLGWSAIEFEAEGFESELAFVEAWGKLHGKYDPHMKVRQIRFKHVCARCPDEITLAGNGDWIHVTSEGHRLWNCQRPFEGRYGTEENRATRL